MMLLFIYFCLIASGNFQVQEQCSQKFNAGGELGKQGDSCSIAMMCAEVMERAVRLNESFENSVSAGGHRALELEAEKYFNTVILDKISDCVTYASEHADAALSKRIFELAHSYSNSNSEVIPLELARLYSRNPEMTRTILIEYEISQRRELIEILNRGLDALFLGNTKEASRLRELKQLLKGLESK
jgi:hypothetical protein